jgi:hypothetical protein
MHRNWLRCGRSPKMPRPASLGLQPKTPSFDFFRAGLLFAGLIETQPHGCGSFCQLGKEAYRFDVGTHALPRLSGRGSGRSRSTDRALFI